MPQITPEELVPLTHRNNATATMLIAMRVVFHIGLSTLGLRLLESGQIVLGLLVLAPHFAAYSFLGWAGIGHELFHNSVFTSRIANQILFRLFSILTWNNYFYFQVSHPHHHRATLAPNDPEGARPMRMSWITLLQLLTVDVNSLHRRLRILVVNAMGRTPDTGVSSALFPPGSLAGARLHAAARIVIGTHLALIAIFLLTGSYWLILIVSLAPFCITFFNRTLAAAQHYGLADAGRDYARSCRTVLLGPVSTFFYADMNYHMEHHYYPAVPHYNLARLHRLLNREAALPNITRGYIGALRELARHGLFPSVRRPAPGV